MLVHSLSVCISLLDPKRLLSSSYQSFWSQLSHGTMVAASPEMVDGMLESLGRQLLVLVGCCNLKLQTFILEHSSFISQNSNSLCLKF